MSAAMKYHLSGPLQDAVRCPIHGRLVAVTDGRLAGCCDQCMAEAARGLRKLARMRKP